MYKLILFSCTTILFCCETVEDKKPLPNIVLIMADDLGYGDLGCYGNDTIKTPNLDKLAKLGVRFTDFHSNGAVCSPTRAALMTGRYQQRSGIQGVVTAANYRDKGLALDETTLAEYLKNQGYKTGIFGKWHLGYDTLFNPVNQGFDEFRGFVSGNVDYVSFFDQTNIKDWYHGKKLTPVEDYQTDIITEDALSFIGRNSDNPFFVYIPYGAPHYPFQLRGDNPVRAEGKRLPDTNHVEEGRTTGNTYRKMVEIMDEGIGKVLQKLDTSGLLDNSIVIFLSDNGAGPEGTNHPYSGRKNMLLEGGHRVPAILYYKDIWEGGTENHSTYISMDIFATLADIVNSTDKKSALDGVSLLDSTNSERLLFWRKNNAKAVRKGNFKLLIRGSASPQLFDLKEDPGEKNDLSSENKVKTSELLSDLRKWEEEMDEYPVQTP